MDDLRLRFAALDKVAVPNVWPEIERRAAVASTVPARRVTTRRAVGPTLNPAFILLIVGLLIAALLTGLVVGSWLNQIVPPVQPTPTAATPIPSATATALSGPGAGSTPNPSLLYNACAGHVATEPISTYPTLPRPEGSPAAGMLAAVGYTERDGYWVDLLDPVQLTRVARLALADYVPNGEGGGIRNLAWSPGGGLLEFDAGFVGCYDAFVIAADGAHVWHVLEGSNTERFESWGSDSSTWITADAERLRDRHVYVRSIATDSRADLGAPCPTCRLEGGPLVISPDGRSVAGTTYDRERDLYRAVAHDDAGWHLATTGVSRALGWLPDGSVLVSGPTASWTPATGETRGLSVEIGDTFEGALPATLSPDGRLLTSQQTPRRVDVVDLSTGVRSAVWQRPSSGDFDFAGPVWSPDSKQLAFSATPSGQRIRDWYVVNADGSNLRKLDGTWSAVAW